MVSGLALFRKNPSLEGTCPQTPAEGRLRPPDPLQTKLLVSVSSLGLLILAFSS